MTSYEEWNRSDDLSLRLYFSNNPLDEGPEGLEEVLHIIEQDSGFLMPDKVMGRRTFRYSRQRAREQLMQVTPIYSSLLLPKKKGEVQGGWSLRFGGVSGGFNMDLHFSPLSFFRQEATAQARCQQVTGVVRALCQRLGPVDYGFAHSHADTSLGNDPHKTDPTSAPGAYEAYWLNVYGKALVDSLGRQRVLSLPAHSVEPLPCGGVLWLSTPSLSDFDSPQARLAQARCLVHLRPELRLEEVERSLLERSLAFQPLDKHFDPDIAGLIELILQRSTTLSTRRKEIERYNLYRPPPVAEWLPAHEVQTDVEDPARKLAFYEVQAESLIAILHTRIPSVLGQEPGSIIEVDNYVGRERWAEFKEHMPPAKRDLLVPMLGGYLGELLVKHLGGRWVPRRSLLEAAVVVGPRAWLPFLRAHHLLQLPSNVLGASLDFTLSQFFHQAVRLASV
ncbi:hypothetical protein [Hyalangium sp.]|uniref:hypothetical protein n=1 Tax=Hyalangium sp. TaxID=2028555 RepID=UPI002D39D80A|nr:hypothetical protein [Hyalangium sp.]HYH98050.1 hypothetical protein [Hyalangium sp.]